MQCIERQVGLKLGELLQTESLVKTSAQRDEYGEVFVFLWYCATERCLGCGPTTAEVARHSCSA